MSASNTPSESFISHLIELRNRLVRVVIVFVVAFAVLFNWAQDLYAKDMPDKNSSTLATISGTPNFFS